MSTKLLFVCMGNICRSPAAEGIMKQMIEAEGLSSQITCDSAGTTGYHVGNPADARMQAHAARRGYSLDSRSRRFDEYFDFEAFDWILTMDESNYHNVSAYDTTKEYSDKLRRMTDFCRTHDVDEVPDPYYGGDRGFEHVMDILEDACSGFLDFLKNQSKP